MCRLLNSKGENASGLPVEYLNSMFGINLRNYRFQIDDWAIPDIQNEHDKKTLTKGYYYYRLKLCKEVTCDDDLREDVESRYFGIKTNFSEEDFASIVGKIVSFKPLEKDIHKLEMVREGLSEDSQQCGFV